MASLCRHVLVTGRVQGVGFRWHAADRARDLGLGGWVRNRLDGRVEAWLEGEPAAVEAMLAWLEIGPRSARVDRLETSEKAGQGWSSFEIVRDE